MGDAIGWFMQVLKRSTDFSGRATRSEYWYFMLVYFVGSILGYIAFGIVAGVLDLGIIMLIPALLTFLLALATISAGVRRFHDIGKPGIWILVNFIPAVGGLIYLYFMTQPSVGDNEYGPIPPYSPGA